MAKLSSLEDLLTHEMQDLYNAEQQILKALPKMTKAASAPELKNAFQEHLQQTEGHVERLEQAFDLLGTPAKGRKCEGMTGIISEGSKILDTDGDPHVIDAALIAAAQKVEHYEIATYGCVATYAELLGYRQVKDLLGKTLSEEEATDARLTQLAESFVNVQAESPAEQRVSH